MFKVCLSIKVPVHFPAVVDPKSNNERFKNFINHLERLFEAIGFIIIIIIFF